MNRKVKQIQSKVRQTQDISYNTVVGGFVLAKIFAFSGILKEEGFCPSAAADNTKYNINLRPGLQIQTLVQLE